MNLLNFNSSKNNFSQLNLLSNNKKKLPNIVWRRDNHGVSDKTCIKYLTVLHL